jgi:hypothetical protein
MPSVGYQGGTVINRIIALVAIAFASIIPIGVTAKSDVALVNETLTREVDVTGDDIPELIILNLRGESWQKPFQWTLTIKAKDSVIFEHQSDDSWLDAFFADKGYHQDCADYLSCKHKYYENDILKQAVVITDLSPNEHAYNKSNSGSIQIVARKELIDKYRVSEDRASQIVESMIRRLRSGKTPVLYVPISAVQSNFPIMYVPEVNGFVKVYEW